MLEKWGAVQNAIALTHKNSCNLNNSRVIVKVIRTKTLKTHTLCMSADPLLVGDQLQRETIMSALER